MALKQIIMLYIISVLVCCSEKIPDYNSGKKDLGLKPDTLMDNTIYKPMCNTSETVVDSSLIISSKEVMMNCNNYIKIN